VMNTRDQLICLWLVPLLGVLYLGAFTVFPGFFPPMSPTMTAEEVANFYRENLAAIRGSMILCNIIGVSLIPFFMVVVVQMLRIANSSRAFAYSYLAAAANGTVMFALADLGWLLAAFRPERDPQLIQLLNDFAWFAFIAPVGFIMVQNVCLALSIYLDARPRPVFPRWVAHFNLVAALLMAPGAFVVVFKTGPLAWDGVLAFWLRLATFAVYVAVMFFVVRSAIHRQIIDERAAV
jgi:hypothetical protein